MMSGIALIQSAEQYMMLTYKELSKIAFPIFALPSSNWHTQDGLFFVDNILVDDRNVDKPTLGQRRLISPQGNFMKLGKAVVDEVGLFKQQNRAFIDSKGVPFIYIKSKMLPLNYYNIEKKEGLGHSCRIKIVGIKQEFLVPTCPTDSMRWAGILSIQGYPWKIYEFSETYKPPTRRKI